MKCMFYMKNKIEFVDASLKESIDSSSSLMEHWVRGNNIVFT